MTISRKAKESIKTALAMTIAYGIALSLDWDRPMWAGFAVAFISLPTVGQSLNKAAMRMLGTFLGVGVAFIIIALTAQERWHFIILLAVYIGICTYMMSGTKHNYFWFVSGFVCAIICFNAGPNSENAFSIAMLRAQETGLGILVYSIIAFLIWPSSSRKEFYMTAQKLVSAQRQLLQTYFEFINDSDNAEQAQAIRFQEIQIRTQFTTLLDAAETDSQEVREMRQLWRMYQSKSIELIEKIEHLRSGFTFLQELKINKFLSNLDDFCYEINGRLSQIEKMMAGQEIDYHPTDISLLLNHGALDNLSNFQKGALALTHSHFQQIETLTRELLYIVTDINQHKRIKKHYRSIPPSKPISVLDLDRLAYAVRIIMIMFSAFLSVIYIDAIPGKFTIVTIATVFGMFVSTMPQLSVWLLLKPALMSLLFAGVLYIFLMPQLSSYVELGPLIFGVTFLICYLFATPKQVLGRIFGLAMFIVITGIDNQQSYSFLSVANTALMFPIAFLIIAVTAYIPISWIPEHVFHRLLKRYFYSYSYVFSSIFEKLQKQNSNLTNYINIFHVNEISKLPVKLNSWAKHIPNKEKSGATTEQIQALVNSIETLSLHIQDLQRIHKNTHLFNLTHEIQSDLKEWCQRIDIRLQKLSIAPDTVESEIFRKNLDKVLEQLEQRIESVLNNLDSSKFNEQDSERFYLLLGGFRSVSEALVNYANNIERINWDQYHEERFA